MSTVYSHSRLECFRQCPRRYRFRYGEGIPPRCRTVEAFLGSQVHAALEYLYGAASRGRVPPREEVVGWYHRRWTAARAELRIPLRILAGRGDEARWRALGAACLERYYAAHTPFPEAARTLGLEREVRFPLDRAGRVGFRGYVDRLTRGTDDYLEIHDYKTAREVPRPDCFDDQQLSLYQLGLARAFPGQRGVRLVWHYLVPGRRVVREQDPAGLAAVRAAALETVAAIEAERAFPPRPGVLCRWCEYRELCPVGRRHTEAAYGDDPAGVAFLHHYAALKGDVRAGRGDRAALRREAGHLKRTLLDFARRTGRGVVTADGRRLVVADGGVPAVRLEEAG